MATNRNAPVKAQLTQAELEALDRMAAERQWSRSQAARQMILRGMKTAGKGEGQQEG